MSTSATVGGLCHAAERPVRLIANSWRVMLRTVNVQRVLLPTLWFLLILPVPGFATSIVAIIGEKSITIAADSILLGKSRESGEFVRTSVCKIRCVDRVCFAASGRYNNDTIQYDVWRLTETELHRAGTPQEVSARFKTIVASLLPNLVAASKKETPDRYAEWLKGRPVLSYLFAGFDRNAKSLVVHGEAMVDVQGRALPIRESTNRDESAIVGAVFLGWNENIAEFMRSNPNWRASTATDSFGTAKSMVQIEIKASEKAGRRDVGEPIAIVTLAPNGFSLDSKGACQEN